MFSVALLVVIQSNLKLYTGQIGYLFEKKLKAGDLFIILLNNLYGVGLVTIFSALTITSREAMNQLHLMTQQKFEKGFITIFLCGIFCGIMIYVAVHCKNTIITIVSIMIFILCGYEHCIALFPYFMFAPSLESLVKFLLVMVGNSIGAIIMNLLLTNKGDI